VRIVKVPTLSRTELGKEAQTVGRINWLLFLVAAPLPGVILALADLTLELRGAAVTGFVALCVVAASALAVTAAIGVVHSLVRHDRVVREAAPAHAGTGAAPH
jgi:hypothetical protein